MEISLRTLLFPLLRVLWVTCKIIDQSLNFSVSEKLLYVCAPEEVSYKKRTHACAYIIVPMSTPLSPSSVAGRPDEKHHELVNCATWWTVHPHLVGLVFIYSLTMRQSVA